RIRRLPEDLPGAGVESEQRARFGLPRGDVQAFAVEAASPLDAAPAAVGLGNPDLLLPDDLTGLGVERVVDARLLADAHEGPVAGLEDVRRSAEVEVEVGAILETLAVRLRIVQEATDRPGIDVVHLLLPAELAGRRVEGDDRIVVPAAAGVVLTGAEVQRVRLGVDRRRVPDRCAGRCIARCTVRPGPVAGGLRNRVVAPDDLA